MERLVLERHLAIIFNELNSEQKKTILDEWIWGRIDFNSLKQPHIASDIFDKNDWDYDSSIISFSPYHSENNSTYELKIFFNSHIFNTRFQICLNYLLQKLDAGYTLDYTKLFGCAERILGLPFTLPLRFVEEHSYFKELTGDFSLFNLHDFTEFKEPPSYNTNTSEKFLDVIFLKYLILKKTNDHFNNNQLNININHNNFYKKLREMNMMVHYEKCNLYNEIHQLLSGNLELINVYIVDEEDNDYYNEIVTEIIQETKGLKSVELFHNRKDNDEFARQLINYFKHKYKIY